MQAFKDGEIVYSESLNVAVNSEIVQEIEIADLEKGEVVNFIITPMESDKFLSDNSILLRSVIDSTQRVIANPYEQMLQASKNCLG